MKSIFSILALLLSFQFYAQIPESLVKLPWDIVNLSSCDDDMGEGPKFNGTSVLIQLVSDEVEEDEFGNCILRTRTWDILDWTTNTWYTYTQQGLINLPEPLMCQESIYLTEDQFPYTLNKDNVLINGEVGHDYSFEYYDLTDDETTISTNGSDYFSLYMYDHTANKLCKTNVFKTDCQEDMIMHFPDFAEIVFDGEPYIEVTPDMLGVEVDLPCDSYTTKIRIGSGSSNVISAQKIGEVVKMKVEVEIENITNLINYIDVKVTGNKPEPISMYIEDVSFVAGETIELDVWSESIISLGAWGLELEFENAEILSLENAELFNAIPINLYPDGLKVRALWYSHSGYGIDIDGGATWFTLTIKPEIDGNTLDIFKSEQNPWNSITIDDDNYLHDYDADFVFNVAPRGVLDVNESVQNTDVKVYPNPSSSIVNISGLSNPILTTKINVYNLEGRLMLSENTISNKTTTVLDISDLPVGLYILKAQNGKYVTSQKISKI